MYAQPREGSCQKYSDRCWAIDAQDYWADNRRGYTYSVVIASLTLRMDSAAGKAGRLV